MKKIILTKGLPASGKSTWALAQELSWLAYRFNKDDIRKEFWFKNTTKHQEELVYKTERSRVTQHIVDFEDKKEDIREDNITVSESNEPEYPAPNAYVEPEPYVYKKSAAKKSKR